MDLTWSTDEEQFRTEVRAWLGEQLGAWRARHPEGIRSGDTAEGFGQHLDWERTLFEDRWAVVSWPEAYGVIGDPVPEGYFRQLAHPFRPGVAHSAHPPRPPDPRLR